MKQIEERYENKPMLALLYWVRWIIVLTIGTILIIYSTNADNLDNWEILFMIIGFAFLLWGTTITSGCYLLRGMYFNFFQVIGLTKKYKKMNFHDLSEGLAALPMAFVLLHYIIMISTSGNVVVGSLFNLAVLFFGIPYVLRGFTFGFKLRHKQPKRKGKSKR